MFETSGQTHRHIMEILEFSDRASRWYYSVPAGADEACESEVA